VALARRLGGPSESSIIGIGDKVSCSNAAFANGELINALDYDALPHVQPFVIPPVLAAAESAEASGRDLILAIVLAEEISKGSPWPKNDDAKINEDLETPAVWKYRHHNIQCAAGAGKILKLDREKMTHALGIAATLPLFHRAGSGINCTKPIIKYAPHRWICSSAVNAVLIAGMGYPESDRIRWGIWILEVYSSKVGILMWSWTNLAKMAFTDILYKFYPVAHFLYAVGLFQDIIDKNNLMPGRYESVNV
jgi:2-methylcitrate dehydratase PrpD